MNRPEPGNAPGQRGPRRATLRSEPLGDQPDFTAEEEADMLAALREVNSRVSPRAGGDGSTADAETDNLSSDQHLDIRT